MTPPRDAEWLEADGFGGFASGTVSGRRRRRYHGLLTVALTPPTSRHLLVSGFDAWIERTAGPAGPEYLGAQKYHPDVEGPDRIAGFAAEPWPTTTFRLADGLEIEQEIFVPHGRAVAAVRWRLVAQAPGIRLLVRPFLAPRDIHALHHVNPDFVFDARVAGDEVRWQPYRGLPVIRSRHNGSYVHAPQWYRNFQLDEERNRGFDFLEDAGSPGVLSWDLSGGDAVWLVAAEGAPGGDPIGQETAALAADRLRRGESLRRSQGGSRLARAAESYLVVRGEGLSVIAGYPWFTDWGRDTFIALRGLCLATGRLEEARRVLLQWAGAVSEGMLPNRFVDQGGAPEYNAVDASLWFVIVAAELAAASERAGKRLPTRDRAQLESASQAILAGYRAGTRFGIHADTDGLLAAGAPGVQLTWMDAKIGAEVVTPRSGKPVEIEALWFNALVAQSATDRSWRPLAERAREAFAARFWNPDGRALFDVVDAGGVPGRVDAAIRPNQIFAVGGLPLPLLSGDRALAVVDRVEADLLTPLGLRTLAPGEPGFAPRCEGPPRERDAAYHQGTAWPWLLGPFVEGWLRVHGSTPATRAEARRRFLAPLIDHLDVAGLGHVSEIADGTAPFTPRGCPFQAWSVGEAIRIEALVADPPGPSGVPVPTRADWGS